MTDKMREAFEKWYMTNTFAHVDHLSVFYNDLNCYPTPIANHCWKAWQAAQAVPVNEDHVISIAGAYESGIGHCNDNLCNPYKVGSAESFAYDYGKEFGKARGIEQSVPVAGDVDCYDAGLLSDFGGGNVEWWQDYIRAELTRAHEFYVSQMPTHSITAIELERLRSSPVRRMVRTEGD